MKIDEHEANISYKESSNLQWQGETTNNYKRKLAISKIKNKKLKRKLYRIQTIRWAGCQL